MRTIKIEQPPTPAHRAAVTGLLAAIRAERGFDPISENKVIALTTGSDSATGVVVADDGVVVGYAHLEPTADGHATEVAIDPTRDIETAREVADLLISTVVAEVARSGGGPLTFFLPDPNEDELAVATRHGFTTERELLVLRRPVGDGDRALDRDERIVPFRPGVDEDDWMALNSRAFSWHPEQGAWSRADLEEREEQSWFDPAGLLCLWIDGQLAGTCWTKVPDDGTTEGEIYVMSVDPGFQGEGLGRILLEAGITHLAGVGCSAAILYVEGDNTPALALYRRFGFTNFRRTVVAATSVAAG